MKGIRNRIKKSKNTGTIFLNNKSLKKVPSNIASINNLQTLVLSGNQLSNLPQELSVLPFLETLDISNNCYTKIPDVIFSINSLMNLNMSQNFINSIPDALSRMENLNTLDLAYNKIREINASIANYPRLERLILAGNDISHVPDGLSKLQNIQFLDLRKNNIKKIPRAIVSIPTLKRIDLSRNPLTTPPSEVANQGLIAIRDYFNSLQAGTRELNEVKVHIIGNARVGKTSLLNRIVYNKFDPNQPITRGINVKETLIHINYNSVKLDKKSIKLHFWDFGGQDFMQPSHQCFYTDRSLYIYVVDGECIEDVDYWLMSIQKLGGDSPVIIVINKSDINPDSELDNRSIREKYKNVAGICKVSCKTNENIEALKSLLSRCILKVKTTSMTISESWFKVKSKIENECSTFINYDDYLNICNSCGVKLGHINTLTSTLHSLGVMLYYRNRIEARDSCLLDPVWLTEAFYHIVYSDEIRKNNGTIRENTLDNIFRKTELKEYYPRNRDTYIIGLMEEFELCYKLNSGTNIVIPQLFSNEKPNYAISSITLKKILDLEISYDFLPKSILPRLLVRLNHDIYDDYYWKNGVILKPSGHNCYCIIETNINDISINIYGRNGRGYLAILLHHINAINDDFMNLNIMLGIMPNGSEEDPVFYKLHDGFSLQHIVDSLNESSSKKELKEIIIDMKGAKMSKYEINNSSIGIVGNKNEVVADNISIKNEQCSIMLTKSDIQRLEKLLDIIDELDPKRITKRNKLKAAGLILDIIESTEDSDTKAQEEAIGKWKEWLKSKGEKLKNVLAVSANALTIGLPLYTLLFR